MGAGSAAVSLTITAKVYGVVYSLQVNRLASPNSDMKARLQDTATGIPPHRILSGRGNCVMSVAYLPNASGCDDQLGECEMLEQDRIIHLKEIISPLVAKTRLCVSPAFNSAILPSLYPHHGSL
jgi:hypothetical protein